MCTPWTGTNLYFVKYMMTATKITLCKHSSACLCCWDRPGLDITLSRVLGKIHTAKTSHALVTHTLSQKRSWYEPGEWNFSSRLTTTACSSLNDRKRGSQCGQVKTMPPHLNLAHSIRQNTAAPQDKVTHSHQRGRMLAVVAEECQV